MAKIAVVEDNDAMREQLCGFIAQYARESGRQLSPADSFKTMEKPMFSLT